MSRSTVPNLRGATPRTQKEPNPADDNKVNFSNKPSITYPPKVCRIHERDFKMMAQSVTQMPPKRVPRLAPYRGIIAPLPPQSKVPKRQPGLSQNPVSEGGVAIPELPPVNLNIRSPTHINKSSINADTCGTPMQIQHQHGTRPNADCSTSTVLLKRKNMQAVGLLPPPRPCFTPSSHSCSNGPASCRRFASQSRMSTPTLPVGSLLQGPSCAPNPEPLANNVKTRVSRSKRSFNKEISNSGMSMPTEMTGGSEANPNMFKGNTFEMWLEAKARK